MFRRLLAITVALGLLTGVVYLGFLSSRDSSFVVWFGIGSAVLAPLGFTLLGYGVRLGDRQVLLQLAQVPEIARLLNQAKTQAERVRLLEMEHARLAEMVRLESRRLAIQELTKSLEHDAAKTLAQLEALDEEAASLETGIEPGIASDEINRLRERLRQRRSPGFYYFSLGDHVYRMDFEAISALPFGLGWALSEYFRLAWRLGRIIARRDAERRRLRGATSAKETARRPGSPPGSGNGEQTGHHSPR